MPSRLRPSVTWSPIPLLSLLLLLGIWSHVTDAQVEFPGPCPKTPVIRDFDWNRYLGRWNDVYRYFVFYQEIGKCWSGTYTRDKRGQISVTLRLRDKLLSKPLKITVNVNQQSRYTPNKLFYSIPGIPFFRDNYEVMRTDYDNWTIEYSCRDKPFGRHAQQVWILTRSRHPSKAVLLEAFYNLKQLGIRLKPFRRSDQSCPVGRRRPVRPYGRSLTSPVANVTDDGIYDDNVTDEDDSYDVTYSIADIIDEINNATGSVTGGKNDVSDDVFDDVTNGNHR